MKIYFIVQIITCVTLLTAILICVLLKNDNILSQVNEIITDSSLIHRIEYDIASLIYHVLE